MSKKTITGFAVADLQLGYRQFGLPERAEDFYWSFRDSVTKAIDARASFYILAGDVTNSVYPHSKCVKVMQEECARMKKAGVRVLAVKGNHDAVEPPWHELADMESLHGEVIDVEGVTIAGMDFMPDDEARANLKDIPDVDIFVMHQTFTEFLEFRAGSALSVLELNPRVGLYVFGDLHINMRRDFQIDVPNGPIFQAGYPGSTELNRVSEPKAKYMWRIDVADKPMVTNVELTTRPVLEYTITCEDDIAKVSADVQTMRTAFLKDPKLKERYDGKPLVFVKFDPGVEAAIPRLRISLQDSCLLRPAPIEAGDAAVARYDSATDIVAMRDILTNWFPATSHEFNLTLQFLEKPDDRDTVASKYIDALCLN